MPVVTSWSLIQGILTVNGSDQAERIEFRESVTQISIDATDLIVSSSSVSKVLIRAYGGDDVVNTAVLSNPVSIDGGSGTDSYEVRLNQYVHLPTYESTETVCFAEGRQVLRYEVGPDKLVTALSVDTVLYQAGKKAYGGTHDFRFTPQGTLYWPGTRGLLQSYTSAAGWKTEHGSVAKLEVHNNWRVYYLTTYNEVYVNGTLSWTNTKNFKIGLDGSVYWHGISGLLQRQGVSSSSWQTIGSGVRSFDVRPNGSVYSLLINNGLYVDGVLSWANTLDFKLDADGSLYILKTQGCSNENCRMHRLGRHWESTSSSLRSDEMGCTTN